MGKISNAIEKSKYFLDEKQKRVTITPEPKLPQAVEEKEEPFEPDESRRMKRSTPNSHAKNVVRENNYHVSNRPLYQEAVAPPEIVNPKLVTYLSKHSFASEQFRMLRTSLLFPQSGNRPRSILVTSAIPGEGKSFVAANLAVATAQSLDNHVLLIDCDIRRPTIHNYFGYEPARGLTDNLLSNTPLSDLILKTNVDCLSILPAGRIPQNPSELLSSKKMGALVNEITKRYNDRIVIIDSPPPHMTSETNAISRWVDGILLVVKFRTTNKEMITEMTDMLNKDKILGVVGNFLDLKAFSYYGKSKYANYGKYYGT